MTRIEIPLLLLALLTLIGGLVWWMPKPDYWALDFCNNLWAPAHLLVQGQSPYRTDPLFQTPGTIWFNAVWFPPIIGLLFPLGWLPMDWAAVLWFLLTCVCLLGILHGARDEAAPISPLAVVLVALFPPLLPHLQYGQFSLPATLLLLIAARQADRSRFLAAGLPAAIALSKPQLCLLALPGLWIAAARRGKWRGALLYPAGVVGSAALLTVPFWIAYPAWIPDLLRALQRNPSWLQPTLFTQLSLWGGQAGEIAAWGVAAAAFFLSAWLWWKYPPQEALPWSLALTTVASNYIWTWDFVLFLPLLWRSLLRQRTWQARSLWGIGWALGIALVFLLRLWTDNSDRWHFWMPWLFFALVVGGQALEKRFSPEEKPALMGQGEDGEQRRR